MNAPIARAGFSASALLRRQFRLAHQLLDAEITGLSAQTIHWRPPGSAAPVGASYAQIVVCEDLGVNGVFAAGTPLALSTWAGRAGLSELPPLRWQADWHDWGHRVEIDLAQLLPYAQAVYAATDAYLAALPDEALDPARDEHLGSLLNALLLTLAVRRGEIACLLAINALTNHQ